MPIPQKGTTWHVYKRLQHSQDLNGTIVKMRLSDASAMMFSEAYLNFQCLRLLQVDSSLCPCLLQPLVSSLSSSSRQISAPATHQCC
jgi:hypothetical protein